MLSRVMPVIGILLVSGILFFVCGCGGGSSLRLSIDQPSLSIDPGSTQQYTARLGGVPNTSVAWSIKEGSRGGIITSEGLYTAPDTPGIYHVIALLPNYQKVSNSISITVEEPPQGKIAFTSQKAGYSEVYLINANGSGLTNLSNNPEFDFDASINPDGSRVVFVSDRDKQGADGWSIYSIKADGTDIQRLTDGTGGRSPVYNASGSKIYYLAGWDIVEMNTDGTGQKQLTQTAAISAFSVDPVQYRFICAMVFPDEFDVVDESKTRLYRLDGNLTDKMLMIKSGYQRFPTFSPDGHLLAFQYRRTISYMDESIFVCNSNGTGFHKLTNDRCIETAPAFNPTGTKIAFVSWRDGSPNLYTANLDGTALRKVADYSDIGQPYSLSWGR